MSYSLKLFNGDLSLEGGSYETVSGGTKLTQDLRCWLQEPTGTDPMHLSFGSVIDGGMLPTGEVVESPIGQPDMNVVSQMVESEIRRVITQYKTQQLARMQADNATYGHSTITPDEVISQIESIDTILFLDGIIVNVKIQTYGGTTATLGIATGG